MRQLLLILCICGVSAVSALAQVRPDFFPEEVNPNNANFELYSQKNGVNRRASLANLRKYFGAQIVYAGMPAPTGNAESVRNKVVVVLPDSATYFVDWAGNATPLGGGVGPGGGEVQNVTISGDTLCINTPDSLYCVVIPTGSGGDNWGTQVVQRDSTLRGNGTAGDPLRVNRDSFPSLPSVSAKLNISDTTAMLFPYLLGAGTAGRIPRYTGTRTFAAGTISDDGTRVSMDDASTSTAKPFRVDSWTTAARPATPSTGDIGWNTTAGWQDVYNGTTWLQGSLPVGTTGRAFYFNGTSWVNTGGDITMFTGTGVLEHIFKAGHLQLSKDYSFDASRMSFNMNTGSIHLNSSIRNTYAFGRNNYSIVLENDNTTYTHFLFIVGPNYGGAIARNNITHNAMTLEMTASNLLGHTNMRQNYIYANIGSLGSFQRRAFINVDSQTDSVFLVYSPGVAKSYFNGKIGIKTETPADTLHIQGTVRITGNSTGTARTVAARDSAGTIRTFPFPQLADSLAAHISVPDGSITQSKLANGAAGGTKIGAITYIALDSVNATLTSYLSTNWLDLYSELHVYMYCDSARSAHQVLTFPQASATYAGKRVWVVFDDADSNDAHYPQLSEPNGTLRQYTGATSGMQDGTTYQYGPTESSNAVMVVCMQHPRTLAYRWVIYDGVRTGY